MTVQGSGGVGGWVLTLAVTAGQPLAWWLLYLARFFPLVKTVSLGLKAVFSPFLELSGAAGPHTALAVRFPALNEVGLKYSAKLLPGGFRALRLQWFP